MPSVHRKFAHYWLLNSCYAIYEILTLFAFYLYSLRSNFLPWGSHANDGLYFLAYFIIVLPAMLGVSLSKALLSKGNFAKRYSYFAYTILISMPAIVSLKAQLSITIGVTASLCVALINLFEWHSSLVQKR